MRATAAAKTRTIHPLLACLAAWAIPGGGHLLMGRWQKGVVLLVSLVAMFVMGLAMQGRLLPIEPSQPLVALAALANRGMGLVFFMASALGYGAGQVEAVTYEYANAFLIVAGLLNMLVVLDAYDVAAGRK